MFIKDYTTLVLCFINHGFISSVFAGWLWLLVRSKCPLIRALAHNECILYLPTSEFSLRIFPWVIFTSVKGDC